MEMLRVLSGAPLFSGISPEELPGLLACVGGRRQEMHKGDILLLRGERVDQLGLVLSGSVHVVREDFWGNRSIVGIAGQGDLFAESYALGGDVLEVTVQAASRGEVLFLSAGKMVSCCDRGCGFHVRLTRNLLTLMAAKNKMLTENMRHLARRTTREKLLSYLSSQALRAGKAEFDIPLDRQQLADLLAVDRSAMSATLGKLRDEGVLEFRKNHFHLLRQEEED